MRVLMTGGGTGGHVNPAVSIAKTILEMEPDSEIAFVGTSRGIENKLVPREGFPLYHIEIQGLKRSFSLSNLKTLYLALTSVGKAKKLIKEFKPDVAIGTGGYVCFPVIKAASQMGIPTFLHESNALPGVAVKALAGSVDAVFTNFEETAKDIRGAKEVIRTGNPLRAGFSVISRSDARKKLGFDQKYRYSLLSCGGSLGARCINREALDVMKRYTSKHPEIHHIHSTGAGNYEAVRAEFEDAGLDRFENLELVDYIYDMPNQMAAADLVINRAGAMLLSELAMMKKPAILIPSPNVTDNHQYKNAKVLSDAGAAVLIQESELTEGFLADTVAELLENRVKREQMSENFGKFAIKDSNIRIYNEIKKHCNMK